MPDAHEAFLLGFKRGAPDWGLLGVEGAADLPAVKWKQMNLDKTSVEARERIVSKVRQVLGMEK
jgi:hypothetical protein